MLLIMTFALRHNLTKKAVGELLTLISLLLPASVSQVFTTRNFGKFFIGLQTNIQKHFFCEYCFHYNGIADHATICSNCGKQIGDDDHFITVPLEEQLKNILPSK